MKKIIYVFLVIMGINSCSKYGEGKIIGTWVNFDDYHDGLREFTFSKDNLTMKHYLHGDEYDIEIIRKYEIIDGIILVENYNRDEYFYDTPFYNYSISNNKLFLSGYIDDVFTRKINKNMKKVKNNLIGNWVFVKNNTKFDFEFTNDNVTIIQYDEHGNSIEAHFTDYDLSDPYLKINNIGNIIKNINLYSDNLLYIIGKNNLVLFAGVGRGDTIGSEILYLNKK